MYSRNCAKVLCLFIFVLLSLFILKKWFYRTREPIEIVVDDVNTWLDENGFSKYKQRFEDKGRISILLFGFKVLLHNFIHTFYQMW